MNHINELKVESGKLKMKAGKYPDKLLSSLSLQVHKAKKPYELLTKYGWGA